MLNALRNFSKGKLAGVLVAIIIVPFVFWGMGSVFSGGNKNSIAKINNKNISTKNFFEHVNLNRIDEKTIKDNLNKNILEELLSDLISKKMLSMEINDLELLISDKILANIIKTNDAFSDEKKKFSRIKYEKYLLENGFTAAKFEQGLKSNELQKILFSYISGGIKIPKFISNQKLIEDNKKIQISYVNLNNVYKNKFSEEEIQKFIKENEDKLKEDYVDFEYIKINPTILTQSDEYNNEFFKKIDEIENMIINGQDIKNIAKKYKLNILVQSNYIDKNDTNKLFKEIYSKRNDEKIKLLEKSDFFLLYKINKIKKVLPNQNNPDFKKMVKVNLELKEKFDLNQKLITQIQNKKFTDDDFFKLANNKKIIKNKQINSIRDTDFFTLDSVKLIYSLPVNQYLLVTDKNNNIFLIKIINIDKNINKESLEITDYEKLSKLKVVDQIYKSYDLFLNSKYDIVINKNTLDRVKNYFQ